MSEEDFFSTCTNTSSYDEKSVHDGAGGQFIDAEGKYHASVSSVALNPPIEAQELPNVEVTLRVNAGTPEGQEGRTIRKKFNLREWVDWNDRSKGSQPFSEDWRAKQLLSYLHAVGVIGEDAFGRENFTITRDMWERSESCQCVIVVKRGKQRTVTDKDTGEKKKVDGFLNVVAFHPLNSEKVADVPIDGALAASAGIDVSASTVAVGDDLDDI